MALVAHPDPMTVPNNGAIACFVSSANTSPGTEASWSVADETIATVTQDVLDGDPPHRLGGVILHGQAIGTTSVTITVTESGHEAENDSITVNIDVIDKADIITAEYDGVKILDKDHNEIGKLLDNQIIDININRELSGNYSVNLRLPYNAKDVDKISRGRYLEVENNKYLLDQKNSIRARDGNPVITVAAMHEYFDNMHIPTLWLSDAYDEIIQQLRRGLYQKNVYMVITCIDTNEDYYDIKRYVEVRPEDSRIETIRKVFQTFGGDFVLWKNHIVVYPYRDPMPESSGLKLEYAINNESIQRTETDKDIATTLHATGGTVEVGGEMEQLEVTVEADQQIKDLYRWPREKWVDFGDVTSETELQQMANQYLKMQERTLAVYNLSVAELKRLSDPPAGDWDIEVGKIVDVKDTDLGIDTKQQVISYRYNPLKKEETARVSVGGRLFRLRMFAKQDDPDIVEYGGKPAKTTEFTPGDSDKEARMPLYGFTSPNDPDSSRGKDGDLWIKYEE